MNSYRISGLPDSPSSDNDATSKKYVDSKTTDMATTAYVTGTSWTNNPTVYRNDAVSNKLYLTGLVDSHFPQNGYSARGNLYAASNIYYVPNAQKLYVSFIETSGSGTFLGDIIAKGGSGYNIGGTGRYWNSGGDSGTAVNHHSYLSIIADNSIWTKGNHIWVTSDQRIKTNIVNLNADKMMNIFRTLRPISFDYIDNMKNNNKKHFGFIAQEINEILPEGITLNTDVIPNNMMKCEIDLTSKIEASFTLKPDDTDISLNYLLLTTESPLKFDTANPYSSTDTYKFKVYCGDKWAKEQDIYIRSEYNVIDDKYTYVIGMKKDVYDIMITEPTLFVYGQYVYDLHILDHDTIYTVATAALQEVDREQQADKVRIAELEATVARQQSLINDILERLKTLEKA